MIQKVPSVIKVMKGTPFVSQNGEPAGEFPNDIVLVMEYPIHGLPVKCFNQERYYYIKPNTQVAVIASVQEAIIIALPIFQHA